MRWRRAVPKRRSKDSARSRSGQSSEVLELIDAYLDQLAHDTHRLLGDVAGVGVTIADVDGRPLTIGASSALAREVDELQYRIGHGPCLNALRGGGGNYVASLASDRRWGSYGAEAALLGAACCLSVPVETSDGVVAVMKVYAAVVDGLSVEQRRIGHDAARVAAGGIGLAQRLSSTSAELADRVTAMDSRRVIDLALGILMERAQCSPDEAFTLLQRYSQTRNVKVRAVAVEVVGGKVPVVDGVEPEESDPVQVAPFRTRGAAPAP